MLTGDQIAGAGLTDWRKLGQGLHARYVVAGFGDGQAPSYTVIEDPDGNKACVCTALRPAG